jgi:four helix bundle protein
MTFNSFEDLEVYRTCRNFKKDIIKICRKFFPKEEKFLLTGQIKDSSRSVTANIAEGSGRYHYQENIQFCRQSRGSLTETLDHFITAFDEEYIDEVLLIAMREKYRNCLKLLNGYIAYLKRQKETTNNPIT